MFDFDELDEETGEAEGAEADPAAEEAAVENQPPEDSQGKATPAEEEDAPGEATPAEEEEPHETDEYRVVHTTRVAVRSSNSVKADPLGVRKPGELVRARRAMDGWIELDTGGWMLLDGTQVGLGKLLEPVYHTAPLVLRVMNPLVLGELYCELEVAENWTVRRAKALCAQRTGLRPALMIPARGRAGERVSEGAAFDEAMTLYKAGLKDGDEFAFIYTGSLERDLRVADESGTYRYTRGAAEFGSTPWMRCLKKNPSHKARIILFSWTGNRGGQGSTHNFQRGGWPALFPECELYEVNWPGRGTRMTDRLLTSMKDLLKDCADSLVPALKDGKPFAFMGFAFGAVIAFEVARAMQASMPGQGPVGLLAVSCEGPGWPGREGTLHTQSAQEFEETLRSKGGTNSILKDPGMKRQYVPVIKADIHLEETYAWEPAPLMRCPVVAAFGTQPGRDKEHTEVPEELAGLWLRATTCPSASRLQPVETDWYILQEASGCEAIRGTLMEMLQAAVKGLGGVQT